MCLFSSRPVEMLHARFSHPCSEQHRLWSFPTGRRWWGGRPWLAPRFSYPSLPPSAGPLSSVRRRRGQSLGLFRGGFNVPHGAEAKTLITEDLSSFHLGCKQTRSAFLNRRVAAQKWVIVEPFWLGRGFAGVFLISLSAVGSMSIATSWSGKYVVAETPPSGEPLH